MKIEKRLKRGEPKLLAPVFDWNRHQQTWPDGSKTHITLHFSASEEDEDHGYDKMVGDCYNLVFETEDDLKNMIIFCASALDVDHILLPEDCSGIWGKIDE